MLKYNVILLNSDYRLFDSKSGFKDFGKAVEWSASRSDEYFVDIDTAIDNEIISTEHYCWKDGKFYELTMDGYQIMVK